MIGKLDTVLVLETEKVRHSIIVTNTHVYNASVRQEEKPATDNGRQRWEKPLSETEKSEQTPHWERVTSCCDDQKGTTRHE